MNGGFNEMMDRVLAEVRHTVYGDDKNPPTLELQRINSHHNFTQQEEHFGSRVWVTRKGAIEARRSNWATLQKHRRSDGARARSR